MKFLAEGNENGKRRTENGEPAAAVAFPPTAELIYKIYKISLATRAGHFSPCPSGRDLVDLVDLGFAFPPTAE